MQREHLLKIFSIGFKVVVSENFKKEAKRLIKKYHSLKSKLELLGKDLTEKPTFGTPLGKDLYKVRLAVAS